MQVGELVVSLGLNTSDFNRALNDAQGRMNNSFDNMKSAGAKITATGLAMAAGIGLAVKSTMDFDAQMSKVQALSGSTAGEFEKLRDQAIQLGSSTSFSASQAASGMQMLAASGMDANKIMGAMPGVLSAAAASGEEMALVAETMGNALNIFGLEATQSAHVADVLAEVANKSSAGIADMAYTMKYAGPVASQLGYSMEDLGAAVIEMANNGIKGEQAGTILRSSLLSLLNPSKGAAEEMDRLKLAVTDSQGEMRPLGDLIGQLKTKMQGMTEAQKAQSLATIFGTEAVSGMMILVSQGPEQFEAYTQGLKNSAGASEAAAKVMQDNLKGAMDELGGSFESAGIAIGTALTPAIRTVAGVVTEAVNAFNEMPESMQSTIAVAGATAAGIALIGGPVLFLVGSLPTITAGFGALTGALGLTTAAAGTAGAAGGLGLLTSAATAVTGPIGLAAAGVGLFAYKMSQEAIPAVDLFGDKVSEETQKAVTSFLDLNTQATTALDQLNWSGQAVTSEMATQIVANFTGMKDQIVAGLQQQNADSLATMRQFFADSAALTDQNEADILVKMQTASQAKITATQNSEAAIKLILQTAASERRALTEQEKTDINQIQQAMVDTGIQALSQGEIESKVIIERMKQQHGEITAQEAAEVVQNSLKIRDETVKAANETYEQRIAAIIQQRDGSKTISAEEAQALIEAATIARDGQIAKAEDAHQGVVAAAKAQAGEYVNEVNWMTGEVLSKWDSLIMGIEGKVEGFRQWLRDHGVDVATDAEVFGKNIPDGMAKGMDSGQAKVRASAEQLAATAEEAARRRLQTNSPSKVMQKVGEDTGQGLANGITAKHGEVLAAAQKMTAIVQSEVDAVNAALNEATSSLNSFFERKQEVLGGEDDSANSDSRPNDDDFEDEVHKQERNRINRENVEKKMSQSIQPAYMDALNAMASGDAAKAKKDGKWVLSKLGDFDAYEQKYAGRWVNYHRPEYGGNLGDYISYLRGAIPGLAKGGITTQEGLINVHPQETILPLSNLLPMMTESLIGAIRSLSSSSSTAAEVFGGTTQTVYNLQPGSIIIPARDLAEMKSVFDFFARLPQAARARG